MDLIQRTQHRIVSAHYFIFTCIIIDCACSYGLEGYQIIMLAITFMFPDDSFDITPFHPLDFAAFCTKILLPKASILLIQQDLPNLNWKSAIKTM
jgi:hypothetical protein